MTIKLTFEFATVDEVVAFLTRDQAQPAPVAEKPKRVRPARPEAPVENAATAYDIMHGRRAIPADEESAPVKAAPKVADAPVQAVAAVGLHAVRGALREVFNVKGAAAATELLKQFGAARVGEVKPADYDKFIAACGK